MDLWKGLKSLGANFIGTTHMTFSAIAADPKLLHDMSAVNEMHGDGRW